MYLSKSDFQLASGCAKKLVYKEKSYTTSNDTNEYMAKVIIWEQWKNLTKKK